MGQRSTIPMWSSSTLRTGSEYPGILLAEFTEIFDVWTHEPPILGRGRFDSWVRLPCGFQHAHRASLGESLIPHAGILSFLYQEQRLDTTKDQGRPCDPSYVDFDSFQHSFGSQACCRRILARPYTVAACAISVIFQVSEYYQDLKMLLFTQQPSLRFAILHLSRFLYSLISSLNITFEMIIRDNFQSSHEC